MRAAMTKEGFFAWRKWMGWSQAQAAQHLGVSKRTVQLYESGGQPVPKTIELACEALTRGVREYTGPEAQAS
jgi:transcriptional regulator with XRE-family HTH domain